MKYGYSKNPKPHRQGHAKRLLHKVKSTRKFKKGWSSQERLYCMWQCGNASTDGEVFSTKPKEGYTEECARCFKKSGPGSGSRGSAASPSGTSGKTVGSTSR